MISADPKPPADRPRSGWVAWLFRIGFLTVAGAAAIAFLTDRDVVCRQTVVNDHVERVCNPIAVDDAKFVAIAALLVLLAAYERDVEFGGLKLSRLKKIERDIDAVDERVAGLSQTVMQSFAVLTSANAAARADGGSASIVIGLEALGRLGDPELSPSEISPASLAGSGLMATALTGWWRTALDFGVPDTGCVILLVAQPLLGLARVMDQGDVALAEGVLPSLTGAAGVAVKSCMTTEAVVDVIGAGEFGMSAPVVIVAAAARDAAGRPLGSLVCAAPREEADEAVLTTFVESAAEEWALVIPHLTPVNVDADGQEEVSLAE